MRPTASHHPTEVVPRGRSLHHSPQTIGDRFIPARSAMDCDFTRSILTETRKMDTIYQKVLADVLGQNRTRILTFKAKPPAPMDGDISTNISVTCSQLVRSMRRSKSVPRSPKLIFDAPDLVDDFCLNLLDWGRRDQMAVALGNDVYLCKVVHRRNNLINGSSRMLAEVDRNNGPVTSVSWAHDGWHIALGLNNSDVQLWDASSGQLLRTLRAAHRSRVGALSWNDYILTTGGMDGMVVNNDVLVRSHIIQTYSGHQQEVCGLKWSSSGQKLASGGKDKCLHIWDLSMASQSQNQFLHRFGDHTAPVKALAWCPFQSNLLTSGSGRYIKFWDTQDGTCLNSVDVRSGVSALLWSKNKKELLSSYVSG